MVSAVCGAASENNLKATECHSQSTLTLRYTCASYKYSDFATSSLASGLNSKCWLKSLTDWDYCSKMTPPGLWTSSGASSLCPAISWGVSGSDMTQVVFWSGIMHSERLVYPSCRPAFSKKYKSWLSWRTFNVWSVNPVALKKMFLYSF